MTMRDGCAGFFTAEALAAGQGIVQTALDRRPIPGIRPDDWRALVADGASSRSTTIRSKRSAGRSGRGVRPARSRA